MKTNTQNIRTKDVKSIISILGSIEQYILEETLRDHSVHPTSKSMVNKVVNTIFSLDLEKLQRHKSHNFSRQPGESYCSIILMTRKIPNMHTNPPSLKTSLQHASPQHT